VITMTETLTKQFCFRVDGKSLTYLIRQIFHYENNPEKALEILKCLHGITLESSYAVINGDAQLVSYDGGITLQIVEESDEIFKKELAAHKDWKKNAEKRSIKVDLNEDIDESLRVKINDSLTKRENVKYLVDASRARRAIHEFDMLAHDLCEECNEKNGCSHVYLSSCCRVKETLSKINIPPAYPVTKARFLAGKPWIDAENFKEVSTIDVIKLAGFEVRKQLLDQYVSEIITRLRKCQRKIDPDEVIWFIDEMEHLRRDLHMDILKEAGFEVMDMSASAQLFRAMIELYLENKAKLYGVI